MCLINSVVSVSCQNGIKMKAKCFTLSSMCLRASDRASDGDRCTGDCILRSNSKGQQISSVLLTPSRCEKNCVLIPLTDRQFIKSTTNNKRLYET